MFRMYPLGNTNICAKCHDNSSVNLKIHSQVNGDMGEIIYSAAFGKHSMRITSQAVMMTYERDMILHPLLTPVGPLEVVYAMQHIQIL